MWCKDFDFKTRELTDGLTLMHQIWYAYVKEQRIASLSVSLSLSLSIFVSPYLQNDVGITSEKFSIVLYRPVSHLEFLDIKKKTLFMNKLVDSLLKMNKPSKYKT